MGLYAFVGWPKYYLILLPLLDGMRGDDVAIPAMKFCGAIVHDYSKPKPPRAVSTVVYLPMPVGAISDDVVRKVNYVKYLHLFHRKVVMLVVDV
jgi:hypothetical protein